MRRRWVVRADGMPAVRFWTRRRANAHAETWRVILPYHAVRVVRL